MPIGALIAGLYFSPSPNGCVRGPCFPLVAGFMVFISLDELLPVAHSYAQEHIAIAGVISSRHGCHGFESLDAFTVKRRVFSKLSEPHPWEARRR